MKLKRPRITLLWIVAAVVIFSLFLITSRRQRERDCTGITVIMENSGFGCVLDKALVMNHLLKGGDTITGKNIRDIDLVTLRHHIMKLPWISDADIYFTLHGILKVRVRQRPVIARLFDRYGTTAYLGSDGTLMSVASHSGEPVLVVSGGINDSLGKNIGKNIFQLRRGSILKEVHKVASFISSDSLRRALICQVYVNGNGELELIPAVDDHIIIIGNADSLDYKFHKLMAFYNKGMVRTGWDTYRSINLRYSNQVICTNK